MFYTVYADEDVSEKEEKDLSQPNIKNKFKLHENKTVIYTRQFGVDETLLPPGENVEEGGMVVVKITPDDQGRFGFNVKGGADLDLPVNNNFFTH